MSVVFDFIHLWHDEVERDGPGNMAVDEWLLETATEPLLRVYRWQPGWGSIGYFGSHLEARAGFPELAWVRRWTGGGTVDHSADWTYTLVIPAGSALASTRGPDSYRVVHTALAAILIGEGDDVRISGGELETGAPCCFENPVCHDLVDHGGKKIAGAGQRRSRHGLLHQGSIAGNLDILHSRKRARALAARLSDEWDDFSHFPSVEEVTRRSIRYANPKWIDRR